jgi:hypothetical protein
MSVVARPTGGFLQASTFDFCGVGVWITWTLAQPDFFPLLFSLSLALTPCLSLFFFRASTCRGCQLVQSLGSNHEDRS